MAENQNKNPVGRPRKFKSAKDLDASIREYFSHQEAKGRPLTMPGLWCFLDVCNDTMTPYMDGTYDTDEENFSETLKKARNFIANHKLEEAMLGNYNPTICIFDLKNNHGYTDRIESKSDITSGGEKIQGIDLVTINANPDTAGG